MSDLDDRLRAYYSEQRLDDAAVDRILRQSRNEEPAAGEPGVEKPQGGLRLIWPVAAMLCVAFGLVFLTVLSQLQQHDHAEDGLTQRVVAEVAKNYRADYPVDVASARYEEVQAHLDRLEFPILPTRLALLQDFELIGGRYCSIQQQLAAQLKVQHKHSRAVYTLYVAPLSDELRAVEPGIDDSDSVRVELWRDEGRLFALAGPQSAL